MMAVADDDDDACYYVENVLQFVKTMIMTVIIVLVTCISLENYYEL